MKQLKIKSIVAGILMIGASAGVVQAQTSDALLKKLVDKGILTTQEAEQLKKEGDNNKTVSLGSSMPDWVTGLKLYADVRARYDSIYFENDDPGGNNVDRQRFRFRVRAGFTATFKDNLELGFRLISSDTDNGSSGSLGQGGNPLSGNATFQNNGSKKYAFIDAAYGKWSPIKNDEWTVSLTAGKMDNPFTFSDLVWDNDYTPEGAAAQISYKLDNVHSFKLTGAGFVIDEVNQGVAASSDPWLVAIQARWDAKWTQQIETTLGVAAMSFSDTENLGNGAVPNINIGNTRNAAGLLVHNYNPLIADAGVTYWLEKAPLYPGRFPIRVFGSVMHNPSASSKNDAFEAGFGVGKAGKKHTWELTYRYRYLEADSIYEEFPDDDYGAYYVAGLPGSGRAAGLAGSGYGAGTNVRGHTVKASYSPFDALLLSITYFRSDLIDQVAPGGESDTGRFFMDATWKF